MRNLLSNWTTKSALFLGISLAATGIASAQATVVGERGAELAPFITTTYLSPDWGQKNNLGFTAGVDYTRFIRSIVQPSLEFRMTSADGLNVGEKTYLGGFKLQTTVHGVHPYAVVLGGNGDIVFHHQEAQGYTTDNSFVLSVGGGAEFNVLPQWKVRADFTEQHWNLEPQILTPKVFSVGVAYSIAFHGNGGWVR
jgi:opacity protein-like surface antigen